MCYESQRLFSVGLYGTPSSDAAFLRCSPCHPDPAKAGEGSVILFTAAFSSCTCTAGHCPTPACLLYRGNWSRTSRRKNHTCDCPLLRSCTPDSFLHIRSLTCVPPFVRCFLFLRERLDQVREGGEGFLGVEVKDASVFGEACRI